MPEIQSRTNAWSPALLGMVIALLGLILAGGGAYLAALGGSWYYVAVGAMFLAAGYLVIKRRIAGFYTYVAAFAFTSVWAFWEVGLSGWQLIPRLVGPFVLLVLAILVAPTLDQTSGRRARKLGLVGVGIFVVALAILIPIFGTLDMRLIAVDANSGEPCQDFGNKGAVDLKVGLAQRSDVLPAGGQATPIVYEQDGKEYLVIMAGGHHFMMTPPGDALIAYTLPGTK